MGYFVTVNINETGEYPGVETQGMLDVSKIIELVCARQVVFDNIGLGPVGFIILDNAPGAHFIVNEGLGAFFQGEDGT